MESFGARLALIRQRMGWGTTREAARECGLPADGWRRWERSGRQPRDYAAVCTAIASRTKCDVAWLAGIAPRDAASGVHHAA